ncbi:type II toxin-antitoxin system VapC family toxin [Patulibacter sp. NPDC049589]|uniref:type II toxin-antitoxin system VapC family toxin n=1 Tax=Patulibacter sp. NPDC049589 TaxID=3154731 RepID=UPI00341EBB18
MRFLLDTQVVVWLFDDAPPRLPPAVATLIREPSADVLLSAVVLWEIAIESSLGKLTVRPDFREHVASFDFAPLPVTDVHAWAVRDLPLHHRDPFDRLLVAQAQVEGATLVSAAPAMQRYDVPVLWDDAPPGG